MPVTAQDVALAEFSALRAELLARSQSQGTIITAALTITAAIGGFALAKADGRIEMLLVLPVVLSGLGLLLVESSRSTLRIAHYLRECLRQELPCYTRVGFRSWEHFMEGYRIKNKYSAHLVIGTVPAALIFAVPSVVSLVLTHGKVDGGLLWLWWGGVAAILLFVVLARTLLTSQTFPQPTTRAAASESCEPESPA